MFRLGKVSVQRAVRGYAVRSTRQSIAGWGVRQVAKGQASEIGRGEKVVEATLAA